MKLVLISDTHGQHRELNLPKGDVLVHAGDITFRGEHEITADFNAWLGELPFAHKVVIAGNHDFNFELLPEQGKEFLSNAIYLNDSGCEIDGVKFWGSPIQPWFMNWAFNRQRGEEIKKHWDLIPDGTDVLITHGPPSGLLDQPFGKQPSVGCWDLFEAIERVKPQLHVFGHIHGGYGERQFQGVQYVNASVVDEAYKLKNAPIIYEMKLKAKAAKAAGE